MACFLTAAERKTGGGLIVAVFPSGTFKLSADDFVSLLLRFVVGGNFPEGYRLQTPRRESQALAECSLQTEEGQARAGASGWESPYPLMVTAG